MYSHKAVKKYIRKGVKNVKKLARKRYQTKTGGLRWKQVIADVNMLKNTINAEKKVYNMYVQNAVLGQVNGNSNGHYILDITPIPAQGATSITRNGASIKHHSSHFQMQFAQQSASISPINIRVYLIRTVGVAYSSVSGVPATFMDPNPFISGGANIYDYNASRNQDYFKTYKVLRTLEYKLAADTASSQVQIRTVKFGMKYSDELNHVKFTADGATTPASGQLLLFITCDAGNCSTSTASTLTGVPVTAVNTGLSLQYNINHYFYDN